MTFNTEQWAIFCLLILIMCNNLYLMPPDKISLLKTYWMFYFGWISLKSHRNPEWMCFIRLKIVLLLNLFRIKNICILGETQTQKSSVMKTHQVSLERKLRSQPCPLPPNLSGEESSCFRSFTNNILVMSDKEPAVCGSELKSTLVLVCSNQQRRKPPPYIQECNARRSIQLFSCPTEAENEGERSNILNPLKRGRPFRTLL